MLYMPECDHWKNHSYGFDETFTIRAVGFIKVQEGDFEVAIPISIFFYFYFLHSRLGFQEFSERLQKSGLCLETVLTLGDCA